jgi:hypothetical protein
MSSIANLFAHIKPSQQQQKLKLEKKEDGTVQAVISYKIEKRKKQQTMKMRE